MISYIRRHAFAVVRHYDGNMHPAARADKDGNGVFVLTAVSPRIVAQVPHHLLQVHRIDQYGQIVAVHIHAQTADGIGIVQGKFLLELQPEFHQINRLAADVVSFVKQGYVFQHLVDALDIAIDDVVELGLERVCLIALLQQIAGMTDGGHRVADFVGKVGSQLSERSQLGGHGLRSHFTQ